MKKIIPIIDALSAIILFLVLLFTEASENFVYIVIMSLFIGWAFPYFVLIVSGIAIAVSKHIKINLIFNILAFLLDCFLIYLVVKIYDKKFLILLIEYIYILVLLLVNIIYLIIYIKKHPDLELKKIKEEKKKNNGVMV